MEWKSTATLLRGALDRVERHIQSQDSSQSSTSADQEPARSSGSRDEGPTHSRQTPRAEFDRLFGYRYRSKDRARARVKSVNQEGVVRVRGSTWKETICLRFKDQSKGPDCMEKMDLAKRGLGLKELTFRQDGDALHIHDVLLAAFNQLEECGGYTLLHLMTNFIEIQPPKGGITVGYLKDIVTLAKLFVRPLQEDIMFDGSPDN